MRKLYLLLDEWNNDKNFVGRELDIICKSYDVTIICNSAEGELRDDVKYVVYQRASKLSMLKGLIRFISDKKVHADVRLALSEKEGRLSKASEVIRFYINGVLFENFLKHNQLLEDGAIYYSYWYFWKCLAIAMNKNKYDISLISRAHGYDLYKEQLRSGYQPCKAYMDEALDKLIFISDHGKNYYLNELGFEDSDRYIVSYLGTENKYSLKEYESHESYVITSCSSLIPLKRVELIIEALSRLDDISIRWIHFGGGPEEENLKQLADRLLSNKSNISYDFKGFVTNDTVLKAYSDNLIDAFITTSFNEGMPVSIMEAMSFGIPIIATSVGNIPYMFCDNGVLMSKDPEPSEISAAIHNVLIANDDEKIKMRSNSRQAWEEKYVANINFNSFVDKVIKKLG